MCFLEYWFLSVTFTENTKYSSRVSTISPTNRVKNSKGKFSSLTKRTLRSWLKDNENITHKNYNFNGKAN